AGARTWRAERCGRDGVDVLTARFSGSAARGIVAVPRSEAVRFKDMCSARRFPVVRIGMTDAGEEAPSLDVVDHFTIGLAELSRTHEATLPKVFGSAVEAAVEGTV